jgi:hypothetical protein
MERTVARALIACPEILLRYPLHIFFCHCAVVLRCVKQPVIVAKKYFVGTNGVRAAVDGAHLLIELHETNVLGLLQLLVGDRSLLDLVQFPIDRRLALLRVHSLLWLDGHGRDRGVERSSHGYADIESNLILVDQSLVQA